MPKLGLLVLGVLAAIGVAALLWVREAMRQMDRTTGW